MKVVKVKFNAKMFFVKFMFFVVIAVIVIAIFKKIGELVTAAKLVEMAGEAVSEALSEAIDV